MKQTAKAKAKILSTGIHLPNQRVLSYDIMETIRSEQQYGIPHNYLASEMGIVERRVAPANTKPSDLAIRAARDALESGNEVDPNKIGAVIFCGIERDQPEPATAHVIQNALGLNADFAFDVANACYGFVDGVQIASSYVKSGVVEQALVVTGEVSSKVLYEFSDQLEKGMDMQSAQKKLGALTLGDAAGAMVIGRSYGYDSPGFELFNNKVDSAHVEKCIYRVCDDGSMEGQMEMGKMVAINLKMQKSIISDTLERTGWEQFDWLLTHQIGQTYYDRLSSLSGVCKSKMVKTFDKLGNITTATLPVTFHKLIRNDRVVSGDRIGGLFAGSGLVAGQFGYRT